MTFPFFTRFDRFEVKVNVLVAQNLYGTIGQSGWFGWCREKRPGIILCSRIVSFVPWPNILSLVTEAEAQLDCIWTTALDLNLTLGLVGEFIASLAAK